MSEAAHVQSIRELAELRAFLITAADKMRRGIEAANAEVSRTSSWLEHEQPARWAAAQKKAARVLQDADEALRRKRNFPGPDGRPLSAMVEQKAVREAKMRLEHIQSRAAATAQWQQKFAKHMYDYHRRIGSAQALVDTVIPQAVTYLERVIAHLEKYVRQAFPDYEPILDADRDESASVAAPPGDEPTEPTEPDADQPADTEQDHEAAADPQERAS